MGKGQGCLGSKGVLLTPRQELFYPWAETRLCLPKRASLLTPHRSLLPQGKRGLGAPRDSVKGLSSPWSHPLVCLLAMWGGQAPHFVYSSSVPLPVQLPCSCPATVCHALSVFIFAFQWVRSVLELALPGGSAPFLLFL